MITFKLHYRDVPTPIGQYVRHAPQSLPRFDDLKWMFHILEQTGLQRNQYFDMITHTVTKAKHSSKEKNSQIATVLENKCFSFALRYQLKLTTLKSVQFAQI